MIESDVIDQAVEVFHRALNRHMGADCHGRDGDWVDGSVEAIVEALLMDGWRLPESSVALPSPRAGRSCDGGR